MAKASAGARVSEAFGAWAGRLDWAELLESGSPRTWLGLTVAVACILAATQWIPGARPFFQLDAARALLVYACGAAIVTFFWITWRDELAQVMAGRSGAGRSQPPPVAMVMFLVSSAWVQFFTASLVAYSAGPGAWVFVGFLLYNATFHGYLLEGSPRTPFIVVGTLAACLGALVLANDASRIALAVATPGAIAGAFVGGVARRRRVDGMVEREQVREALRARVMEESVAEARVLESTLARVLGQGHDAGNTLMGALLDADALALALSAPGPLERATIEPLAQELRRQLHLVAELTKQMREEAHARTQRALQPVDVGAVLTDVVARQQRQHPGTTFALEPLAGATVALALPGGPATLTRVMENLLLNAAQGDGTRSARQVVVGSSLGEEGKWLRLSIRDDGPGFPPPVDGATEEAFRTTKAGGLGLGLFTVGGLVRASGGTFRFENRPEGGAEVEVVLPLRPAPGHA